MLAVSVCGWLMERELRAIEEIADPAFRAIKVASVRFYQEHVVPKAHSLKAAVFAGAAALHAMEPEAFAASSSGFLSAWVAFALSLSTASTLPSREEQPSLDKLGTNDEEWVRSIENARVTALYLMRRATTTMT